jgi:aminopeptidase N
VYLRGGLTLHALRLKVGDDTFFSILQTYTARYRYGNAGTADFIAVAQEVSGQDLQAFFDSWLYAKTIPDIPELDLRAPTPTR